jgi:hypothetical protein
MADSETYAHIAYLETMGSAQRRVREDGSHEFLVTDLVDA